MQPVPEQVQEEGEAGAAYVEETQWLWVWDLWKEVSRARQSKGAYEGMFIVQKFSKCTYFFVFRFTQGKDHISARNAAQPLASSQTSSLTGLKTKTKRRVKSLFQENALPRTGTHGRGGKTPTLLFLWYLRQELRQQGMTILSRLNTSRSKPTTTRQAWSSTSYTCTRSTARRFPATSAGSLSEPGSCWNRFDLRFLK